MLSLMATALQGCTSWLCGEHKELKDTCTAGHKRVCSSFFLENTLVFRRRSGTA